MAAQEDVESFREVFDSTEVAFFVVGLGGGTGTGATPILVDAAHQNGALTICFATLPFGFEGPERQEIAQRGLNELRTVADAVIVVPNERLFDTIQGQDNLVHSFRQTDQVLSQSVLSIWMMITRHGLINLDFADLRRVISATGGTCVFGSGYGEGFCKANDAARAVLTSPLLVHGQLVADAAGLLISIIGGPDLTLSEIDEMMRQITDKSDEDARVCMGVVIDDSWRDRVSITIIASETWGEADVERAKESVSRTQTRVRHNKDGSTTNAEQTSLQFETYGKGKFKDVEPTLMDGTDLDIPTFWRRGIPIEK
jgi:cell division protein FtsZ